MVWGFPDSGVDPYAVLASPDTGAGLPGLQAGAPLPAAAVPQMPGYMGAPAPQQPPGGLFGGGGSPLLQAIGLSLLSSPRQAPLANLANIFPTLAKSQADVQSRQQLAQALIASGMSPQEAIVAATNPQVAKMMLDQKNMSEGRNLVGLALQNLTKGSALGGINFPDMSGGDTTGGGPAAFGGAAAPDTVVPSTGSDASGMSVGGALTGRARLSFDQLRGLATQAGFKGDAADKIAAISLAESGGDPFAVNPADPGGSYGLTQINQGAHGDIAQTAYGNPLQAMKLAYAVSKGGETFQPWSTYTSGAYRSYLQPQRAAQTGAAPQAVPAVASGPQQGASEPPMLAVGDSLAAHLIRRAGVPGQEDARNIRSYRPGDTAVSGYTPNEVLRTVIPGIPDNQIRGRNVILSTGASNDPSQLAAVPQQIAALKQRGAANVVVMGVGTAPQLQDVNDTLAQIAAQNGATFSGPLRNVAPDQIHSTNPRAELTAIRGRIPAPDQPPQVAAADVAQARQLVPEIPLPKSNRVSGVTQRQTGAQLFQRGADLSSLSMALGAMGQKEAASSINTMAGQYFGLAGKYLAPTELQTNIGMLPPALRQSAIDAALLKETPQYQAAQKYATTQAEINAKLGAAGLAGTPAGQQAAANMLPDTRPSAVREAEAAMANPPLGETMLNLRRAGAANVQQRVEGQAQTAVVNASIKAYEGAQAAAMQANKQMQQWGQMAQALQGFTPGATADMRMRSLGLLRDMGFKVGDEVPAEQMFRMASRRMQILAQPKGQGAVSNFERDLYQQALPYLTDTPEAVAQAIDIGRRLDEYDLRVAQIHQQVAQENGGIPNMIEAQQRINALGSPLSGDELAALQGLRERVQGQGAASGGSTAGAAAAATVNPDGSIVTPYGTIRKIK